MIDTVKSVCGPNMSASPGRWKHWDNGISSICKGGGVSGLNPALNF